MSQPKFGVGDEVTNNDFFKHKFPKRKVCTYIVAYVHTSENGVFCYQNKEWRESSAWRTGIGWGNQHSFGEYYLELVTPRINWEVLICETT